MAVIIGNRPRLIFVFMLFLFGICNAIAQEKEFLEYNCAITPPAGWIQITNLPPHQAFCAVFGSTSRSRILNLVIVDTHKPSVPINDPTVDLIERGFESSGLGKRETGRYVKIAGIKSYERTGHSLVKGRNASTIVQAVLADGRFYSLQAMWLDGDASQDPEIRQALASFRFLAPPTSPDPLVSGAYRVGYTMRRYLPIAVLGVGAIGAVLAFLLRKKSAKSRQPPPPLPPNVQP